MKRVAFWGTVAGVSLITPFAVQKVAARWPSSPVATFAKQLAGGK